MQIILHKRIGHDLRSALDYYEREGGCKLADRFYDEVQNPMDEIERNPAGHHFSDGGLRRAHLKSFPYNILFEIDGSSIWVGVLRHDRRHPNFGLRRRKST